MTTIGATVEVARRRASIPPSIPIQRFEERTQFLEVLAAGY
jgi:hypothetical protein